MTDTDVDEIAVLCKDNLNYAFKSAYLLYTKTYFVVILVFLREERFCFIKR